jgi:monothiol glutaredoxin
MPITQSLRQQITELVTSNEVVLFMKGTRGSPACGFSARVVQVLDDLLPTYATVDVLADPQIREGIKEYSEWPTIPQLYVKGKFVGGADIVKEMYSAGELQGLLGVSDGPVEGPVLTITSAAAKAFKDALEEGGEDVLRLGISPRFEHDLFFGPKAAGDVEVAAGGLLISLDKASARRANGISIDFVTGPSGGGFKIDNPNEPPKVKQMSPEELKKLIDSGAPLHLFDVRTEKERAIARIEGARLLDHEGQDALMKLDKTAPIVFHCHHGGRSQAAAEHFVAQGFRNVHNLRGGIDAWSMAVDPKVPRY